MVVLAIVAGGLALRLWHLQFQSLWWDEGVSIYLSGAGLRALTVAKDFSVDLHPPGYHVLLAAWRLVFGPSVFSMRLLSVFSGILAVPLVYTVSRAALAKSRLGFGLRINLIAALSALLAAVSPIDVYYSQESRMYPLLPVIGLLSLLATLRVARAGRTRDWAMWIAANVVGLYVYYYLGLLTVAESAFLLVAIVVLGVGKNLTPRPSPGAPREGNSLTLTLSQRERGSERPGPRAWVIANVVIVGAFLPWVVILARGLRSAALALPPQTETHPGVVSFLVENWRAFTVGFDLPPQTVALMALWALLAICGTIALGRQSPGVALLLVGTIVIALAGAGSVLLARPFFYPRFILFVEGPIWLLTATGLAALPRPSVTSVVLVVPLLAGHAWTLNHQLTTYRVGIPDDYRVVLASLASVGQAGDAVFCGYPWEAGYVDAYLGLRGIRGVFMQRPYDFARVQGALTASGRAWVFGYDPERKFLDDPLDSYLTQRDPTSFVDQYGDSRVRLYGGQGVEGATTSPLAHLGASIDLLSATISGPPVRHPGDLVATAFTWRARSGPAADYTVFVHALGPDGKVHGQLDSPPLRGAFPTSSWGAGEELVDRYAFALDPAAPPGDYQVEIGLYDPKTGKRLDVTSTAGTDNRRLIGAFTVEN
jgi:hypothetical protein